MEKARQWTDAQAIAEANRCLKCYDAPCTRDCPANVDVPKFINRIAAGDWLGAAQAIFEKNPLGFTCGEVCPADTLCQSNCNCGRLTEPIEIATLQATAMRKALLAKKSLHAGVEADKSSSVAVIGGGPGGVAAAFALAKRGYAVTLFEKEERLGGIPLTQIPNDRLDKGLFQAEIDALLSERIAVKAGCAVDKAHAERILEAFDAVYISCGLGESVSSAAPIKGVWSAEDFLEKANKGELIKADIGDFVLVQGGGNTAIDAAVTAKNLGAERVSVCYRRSRREMPAWREEFLLAADKGVEFKFQTQVMDTAAESGRLTGVLLAPVKMGDADAAGRRKPVVLTDKKYPLAASALIHATGREENDVVAWIGKEEKVFVGGDASNGGETVVRAVADALRAAERIDAYLSDK